MVGKFVAGLWLEPTWPVPFGLRLFLFGAFPVLTFICLSRSGVFGVWYHMLGVALAGFGLHSFWLLPASSIMGPIWKLVLCLWLDVP